MRRVSRGHSVHARRDRHTPGRRWLHKHRMTRRGAITKDYTYALDSDWTVLLCVMWQSMIRQYCYV